MCIKFDYSTQLELNLVQICIESQQIQYVWCYTNSSNPYEGTKFKPIMVRVSTLPLINRRIQM